MLDSGNLNNQKMSFLQACRIAAKNNYIILEPVLGSTEDNKKHWFFDIFDYDSFVQETKSFFTIVRHHERVQPNIVLDCIKLFWLEMDIEEKKRREHIPYVDEIELAFYRGLKLNERYRGIVDSIEKGVQKPYVAIHVRIEGNWPHHIDPQVCGFFYLSKEEILEKYKFSDLNTNKHVYLATGYDKEDLLTLWRQSGYFPYTHGKITAFLDYVELSAIDFEMCLRAEKFLGNNESSFSNIAVHERYLAGKGECYTYNSRDKNIYPRTDYGLHLKSLVCKFTEIKNYPHVPSCPLYGCS